MTIEDVYVIRLKFKNTGSTGYHSVWTDSDDANRVASILNSAHGDMEYTVEPRPRTKLVESHRRGETQIRFENSVGSLVIQPKQYRRRPVDCPEIDNEEWY